VILWLSSALAILTRVYSLRFDPVESAIQFWLPYLILVFVTASIVLTRKDYYPLVAILGLAFVLHLIPFLREPEGLIWNTDPSHNLQIARRVVATGHLALGYNGFTGVAFGSSFYPGLELLLCSLNMVSGFPLMMFYKCAFAAISITALLLFFLILKMLFNNSKIVNLSLLLYVLCPRFHGFDGLAVHESLAIIFFPLLMGVFLVQRGSLLHSRGFLATLLVSASLLAITHHFTFYMLILYATFIVVGVYVWRKKILTPQIYMLFLLLLFMFLWQAFAAADYFLKQHGFLTLKVLESLFARREAGPETPITYSLPSIERYLTYAGFALLALTSLVGFYQMTRKKNREPMKEVERSPLIIWWAVSAAILVVFEIVPWRTVGGWLPIRFRDIEFAYFGIVPLSAVGVQNIINLAKTKLAFKHLTKAIALLMLGVIAVPTVLVGFPYFYYDNSPPKTSDFVNPVESHISSLWIVNYNTYSQVIGSPGGTPYVSGEASVKFINSLRDDSVEPRKVLNMLYWIKKANLLISDPNKLDTEDDAWLNSQLNRIYDSGAIMMLSPRNYTEVR
jgi:hypothetical protein